MGWSRFGAARRRKHEESGSASRASRKYVVAGAVAALAASTLAVTTMAEAATTSPWNIDGNVADAGTESVSDPHGNTQELGPVNASRTKLGVIHNAATPMLGTTNPNAQVDLNNIWIGTKKDTATNTDTWLYFGWQRDSSNGSGVIMYEFMKGQPPTGCEYASKTNAQLIAGCNPWKNRSAGDFILVWDQVGTDVDIIKRTWSDVDPGSGVKLVLSAGDELTDAGLAEAEISSDGFKGEASVNLSQTVFNTVQGCVSYGNVVPGTVTGNSDTADYKDTVLDDFSGVTISNCGSVKVTKQVSPTTETGSFPWTLDRANGAAIGYAPPGGTAPTQVVDTTFDSHGDNRTVTDVIPGTNYRLVENLPGGSNFQNTSVVCTTNSGAGTAYTLVSNGSPTTTTTFPVIEGQRTDCVLTNTLLKASPQLTTVQNWTLHDTATVTGIRAGGTPTASVRFRLYDGPDCTGTLIGTETDNSISSTGGASTTTGINVTVPTTYYWEVRYSGDSQNNPYTTCDEVTSITARDAVNSNWVPNP